MEQITIRQADFDDPADAVAIVDLIESYALEPQGGGKPLPADVKARIVPGMQAVTGAVTFLAFLDDEPVGAAICFQGFSTFAGKPLINVHDLSVRKEFRGRGIGSQLLRKVEEFASSRGCGKVTLEVREVNPLAERLYRRLGYGDPSGFATRFLDKPLSSSQG